MRVGFIGLGSQGGPMARRIAEAGFETTLWARRQASLEPYADTPAKTASSPAEMAAASDLVCLCVVGDDDVREVIGGENGVLAGLAEGGIIAIHSTVHPDTCQEIAEKAAAQGVSVIDAPVSGGGPAVEEGTLLVMIGGDEDVVDRCRPVFATYADPIVHLGPLGSGQNAKILNNLLFSANLGSAISTLELGESLGIDRAKLVEVVNRGSATSKAVGSIAVFGGTLEGLAPIAGALLQKDVRHAASLAAAASAPEGAVFTAADAALESMEHNRVSHVGFVGAGRMGAPMVRRLVECRPRACAHWAEPPRRAQPLSELGAQPVAALSEVADGADVVAVCVFTDDQVREICLDGGLLDAMPPGSVLIVHTTGSPRTAEALAARAPLHRGGRRTGERWPTRHRRRAHHAVRRRRRCRRRAGPAGAGELRRSDPARGRARCGPVGEVDQQHAVRRADRAAAAKAVAFGDRVGRRRGGSAGGGRPRQWSEPGAAEIVGARGSVQEFIDSVGRVHRQGRRRGPRDRRRDRQRPGASGRPLIDSVVHAESAQ